MSEILEGDYKMNKFPIGSIIKSQTFARLVTDFWTTEDGVGIYELELISVNGLSVDRFEFTQEYVETVYQLEEGEEDEN